MFLARNPSLCMAALAAVLAPAAAAQNEAPHWPVERSSAASFTFLFEPALADFDGDGRLDLAGAPPAGAGVAVAFGDGFSRFAPGTTLPAPAPLYGVAAGDFDADGDADVVALAGSPRARLLFRNDGSGNFTLASTVPVAADYDRLAATDADGDGDADLFLLGSGPLTSPFPLLLALGGPGGFGATLSFPNVGTPQRALAADADADGDLDVVAITATSGQSRIELFLRTAPGVYAVGPVATAPVIYGAAAADVDGDGDADLVTNELNQLALRLGPSWFASAPQLLPVHAGEVRIADAGGDGDADLLVFGSAFSTVFENLGGGTFAAPVASPFGGAFADVAHVNGDAQLDAVASVIAAQTAAVALGAGGGAFATQRRLSPNSPTLSTASALADVDGDGNEDAVLAFFGALEIHFGDGAGSFAPITRPLPFPGSLTVMRFAEMTGDGVLDLVTIQPSDLDLVVLQGDGLGNFATKHAVVTPPAVAPFDVQCVDLDGDGDLDVVGAFDDDGVGYALNDGTGVLSLPNFVPPAAIGNLRALRLALDDQDGDGRVDVLASAPFGGHPLAWLQNSGAGSLVPASVVPLPVNASGVVVADADGVLPKDVLVANGSTVRVLTATAPFTPGPVTTVAAPGQSLTLGLAADADGDGDEDAVFAAGAGIALLPRLAAGGYGEVRAFGSTIASGPLSARDVDGDGTADVLDRHGNLWTAGCPGATGRHGYGCAGSGGFVPRLAFDGCATPGGTLTLRVEGALGSAPFLLAIGTTAIQAPIGPSGCSLLVGGLLPVMPVLPTSGTGPGDGELITPLALPPALPVVTVVMQAFVADAGAVQGYATTQGVTLIVR